MAELELLAEWQIKFLELFSVCGCGIKIAHILSVADARVVAGAVPEECLKHVILIEFGLHATDDEDDNEVEEVFESDYVSEQCWQTRDYSALYADFTTQSKPKGLGTTALSW